MTKQERMYAMLDDVVKHFSKNPVELRSTNNSGKCSYYPPKDKPKSIGCAIGMYINWEDAKKLDRGMDTAIIYFKNKPTKNILLPKWMKELNYNFLHDLQDLHDHSDFWSDYGLSKNGLTRVDEIKNNIKTNYYA